MQISTRHHFLICFTIHSATSSKLRRCSYVYLFIVPCVYLVYIFTAVKQLNNMALLNKSPQSYRASLAIWDFLPPDTSEHTQPNLNLATFIYRHLRGNPDQQRFTTRSGVLTGNDARRRSAIRDSPLPERTVPHCSPATTHSEE